MIASAGLDLSVCLWDVATGRLIGEPLRGDQLVRSIAFSPDGNVIASGGDSSVIRLWDVKTGRSLGELLRGHADRITSIAFSPDGKALVSGSWDETVHLWNAVPVRDRLGQLSARLAMIDKVRGMLAAQLSEICVDRASLATLQESVLADRRFAADLPAALIVIGEISVAYEERLDSAFEAFRGKDWPLFLREIATISVGDLLDISANGWNEIAWAGLTQLPAGSPERDLARLQKYAERAVALSDHKDSNALDTLARVHWELGDKVNAIEVQREAVQVSASALGQSPSENAKALHAEFEETLRWYEQLPPGAALPNVAAPAVKPTP
jgi:hypothetical protein